MDPGHRQPGRAGAAGAPDVGRHQRHPQPQAALGSRAARRVPGDRGRAARDPLAELRGRLVPVDRHHGRDLLRRRRALAGRARPRPKTDDESEPGRALRQRPDRGGRHRRPARDRREAAGRGARRRSRGSRWFPTQWDKVGQAIGVAGNSRSWASLAFAALAFSLYYFARKPLESTPKPPLRETKNPGGLRPPSGAGQLLGFARSLRPSGPPAGPGPIRARAEASS